MDKLALLKKIKTIELQMRGMSQHIFSGNYQSAFKGRGMSFSEVRSYQIGDDVRSIDWNVTARFREPFVKVFEEERELTVLLIIDVSGSMFFGKTADSKLSLAIELMATIGFSAAKKNDKVAACFVSDKVEFYIPPKKGFGHVHFILRKLMNLEPKSKGTDLNEGLKFARNLHKQRSICFVISDFTEIDAVRDGLANTARKHDLLALCVEDTGEYSLPKVGFVRLMNSETNTMTWVDSSSNKVQAEYARTQKNKTEKVERSLNSLKIDHGHFNTGEPVYKNLLSLIQNRK